MSDKGLLGLERIYKERQKQIQLGWSLEHDDRHENEELADAAVFYTIPEKYGDLVIFDPWHLVDKKFRETRIRQLEIAGALIAAEIDRLLRLE